MLRGISVCLVTAAIFTACGAIQNKDELTAMKSRMDEMARRQAQLKQRVEELNNQIFLLEDKIDTRRVAAERAAPPQMPVIRLKPEEELEEQSDVETPPSDAEADEYAHEELSPESRMIGDSIVEEKSVLYSGAAKRKGPRPLLRLDGSSNERITQEIKTDDLALNEVQEKIPLAPLPDKDTAKKLAAQAIPRKDYQAALTMYRDGKYQKAAEAFKSFLTRYDRHAYADNALYWLGECFYDLKNYQLALKMFHKIVDQYPTGNKAPDALLKIAYCYLKLQDKTKARTVLAQLVQTFPKSQVASLASKTLVKLQ